MDENVFYRIALTLIPNIGPVHARTLLSAYPNAKTIFKTPVSKLERLPGIGNVRAKAVRSFKDFHLVEKEIAFIEKNHIQLIEITDNNYPKRLMNCDDAPIILYYKGNLDLNTQRIIAVIGTRHNTEYGRMLCERFIAELPKDILVVSGLAHGIDSIVHKSCLKNNIGTVGVLGHGLDRIYPSQNKVLAKQMLEHGGLLTDFISETNPDRENFPKRNRIVAGMCDATVVIESGNSGGSIITADIAASYNRDVFAFPGRVSDTYSDGCNALLFYNKAQLIRNAADLLYWMNWEDTKKNTIQRSIFLELDAEEQIIADHLKEKEMHIDEMTDWGFTPGKLSGLLLNLELKGALSALPGKRYRWIG